MKLYWQYSVNNGKIHMPASILPTLKSAKTQHFGEQGWSNSAYPKEVKFCSKLLPQNAPRSILPEKSH